MILLGVSGGPDSMYLLDEVYNHRKDIIVATVNYNFRENSSIDFEIVRDYCKEKNITFKGLEIDKNDSFKGNFENWARQKRFIFFKKIYEEFHCEALYLAHQKDDFLESAMMQRNANRSPFYYGIKPENIVYGMIVKRPLVLKLFKNEIITELDKRNIKYAIDYTNELPIYSRNKIRIELNKLSNIEKQKEIDEILIKNNELKKTESQVIDEYNKWEKTRFDQSEFMKYKNQISLIYMLIHKKYNNVNLTKNKIKSIIDFILCNNRTNKYMLMKNVYLVKIKGKLIFNINN
ncbi:tRNA lysidine(34) synthetase TilS [Mycoplasmopsis primatum]|uniref:tRNA lysidine(34) synthetase TilS n=1 Tax=Mycoplasmopsis primatum TaxID=55604 RepID=UPI000494DEB0|nr:tRNA lysidine(34) synthetase TilS [Mycoplasmopsis primatum]